MIKNYKTIKKNYIKNKLDNLHLYLFISKNSFYIFLEDKYFNIIKLFNNSHIQHKKKLLLLLININNKNIAKNILDYIIFLNIIINDKNIPITTKKNINKLLINISNKILIIFKIYNNTLPKIFIITWKLNKKELFSIISNSKKTNNITFIIFSSNINLKFNNIINIPLNNITTELEKIKIILITIFPNILK